MIAGWALLLVSLTYVGALFALAWWGDRTRLYPQHARLRPWIYGLALAVYCSSWTFYGAVGTAVREGFNYLPIYLGPLLLFTLGLPFFTRLVRLAKQQNATSISDLLSARFGRSPHIAMLVTVVALTAAIPYIALQLKAIAMSIHVLTGDVASLSQPLPWYRDSTFLVALLLAAFASLFGTRVVDATEHHPGMVLAIAAESVIKLLALLCVGVYAWSQLNSAPGLPQLLSALPRDTDSSISFVTQTLIAFTAMFCLPRQFQIGVVECVDPQDVPRARWLFPVYMVLISIVVVPIANLAQQALAHGATALPDAMVLWLPLSGGQQWLALLAYLGGFSAATGMVIVASVALATMVSNDLVLPVLLNGRVLRVNVRIASTDTILWIRRLVILSVLLAAYWFFHTVSTKPNLAAIGLLAFAAVAQFAPAMLACVYWQGASRRGVLAGLLCGFFIWLYCLLLPAVLSADGGAPAWLQQGPFGLGLLAPQALLGFTAPDPLTHGVFWSLLLNGLALIGFSLRYPPTLIERLQAAEIAESTSARQLNTQQLLPGTATVEDLSLLAQHLLGADAARRLLHRHATEQGSEHAPGQRADVGLLQALERELAAALGASTARMVLTSALRGAGLKLGEVVTLLDAASQKLRFNRELLEAVVDNMPQGVSVVDADMRLVAWNQHYLNLFQYPPELIHAGRPIADLIRYNAQRGWCGSGDPELHVHKRIEHMRGGSAHVSERRRGDGRVIEIRGQPLPDGGFISTFSDVTHFKQVEHELRDINETLEQRVNERTRQLALATADAQQANLSKTRFVAAASHDLLQPLNAARLFNAALRNKVGQAVGQAMDKAGEVDAECQQLTDRVDNSLQAAEELLDALLDISRLDSGTIRPVPVDCAAQDFLAYLHEQFAPLAAQRGITLQVHATQLVVHTDPRLLRRVLQNFMTNALRYTRSGRVVVGCRRRHQHGQAEVEFQVLDTGPGIAFESQHLIFEEFRRLDQPSPWGEKGLGLGLSICDRMARVLGARLTLTSRPGHGSAFGICVARASSLLHQPPHVTPAASSLTSDLRGLRVLCIDDDPDIVDAMRELLTR